MSVQPPMMATPSMGTWAAGTATAFEETHLTTFAARSAAIEAYLIHIGSNYSDADCPLENRSEDHE